MRKTLLSVLVLGAAAAVPAAHATQLGLDFNDHAFNAYGSLPLNPAAIGAQASLDAGYLYNNQRSHDHLNFVHFGMMANGSFGIPGATAGLGVRVLYADREDYSGGGAAIGGRLAYRFPALDRLSIDGSLFYGPDVLTGGDFSHTLEYQANIAYQVIRPASLYVGYRRLELPVDAPNSQRSDGADDGWHVGVRVNF